MSNKTRKEGKVTELPNPSKILKERLRQCKEMAKSLHDGKYEVIRILKPAGQFHCMFLEFRCFEHGRFETYWGYIKNTPTAGCRKCSKKRDDLKRARKAEERCKRVFDNKHTYDFSEYVNFYSYITITFPKHGDFRLRVIEHIDARRGCRKCFEEKHFLNTENFIRRAREVHGDRYDYSLVKCEKYSDMVEVICPEHGNFMTRAGTHIMKKIRCMKCFHGDYRKESTANFIKVATELHSGKYDYSKIVYKGNKKKVEIICPIHGSFWVRPNSHTSSLQGCRKCRESKGETKLRGIFDELGFEYDQEHKLKDSKYRYDFYIPKAEILIEYHGPQHYRPVELFGGEKAFEELQCRDVAKVRLAVERRKHLIVIPYTEFDNLKEHVIKELRRRYLYWYLVNGETVPLRDIFHVIEYFDLPRDISVRKIDETLTLRDPSIIRVL